MLNLIALDMQKEFAFSALSLARLLSENRLPRPVRRHNAIEKVMQGRMLTEVVSEILGDLDLVQDL